MGPIPGRGGLQDHRRFRPESLIDQGIARFGSQAAAQAGLQRIDHQIQLAARVHGAVSPMAHRVNLTMEHGNDNAGKPLPA